MGRADPGIGSLHPGAVKQTRSISMQQRSSQLPSPTPHPDISLGGLAQSVFCYLESEPRQKQNGKCSGAPKPWS